MIKIKRRIVQHGNTSLTISLPIKWVKRFNIKKGDEIDVEEQNNAIVISTGNSYKIEEKNINTKELDTQTLKWLLSALYKKGNDEVKINFNDPEHMQIILDRVNQLMGYTIIEQSQKNCLIKNISEAREGEFDSTLKRAFLLTISMTEGIYEVFKEGKDYNNLQSLINIEETNNQLTGFCHRIINKKGYKEFEKTAFVYVVVWLLESIADEYRDICKLFLQPDNRDIRLSNESLELFKDVNDLVRLFYNVFYDYSYDKIVEISLKRKDIRKRAHKLMQKKISCESVLAKYLDSIALRVHDSIGSVLAMNS